MSSPHDPFSFDVGYGDPDTIRAAADPNRPPSTGAEWKPNGRAADAEIVKGSGRTPFDNLDGDGGKPEANGSDPHPAADDDFEGFEPASQGQAGASQAKPREEIDHWGELLLQGFELYTAVRTVAPGARLRVFLPAPLGRETDVDEAMARVVYETAAPPHIRDAEAQLRKLRRECPGGGQAWAFVDGSETGIPVDSLTLATDADIAQDATGKAPQEQVRSPNAAAAPRRSTVSPFSRSATTRTLPQRALAAMGGQTVTAAAATVIRNEAVAPAGDTLFPDFCPAQTWRVIQ